MSFAYENVKGAPIRNKRTAPPMIKNRVLRISHPILDLQYRLGNQSVQNRIQRCPLFLQRCPTGGVCHLCPTSKGVSLQSSIQPKLIIGQHDDKYEQEADRVAEQVMKMPEPKLQKKSNCPPEDSSCSERDMEEDMVQRQEEEEEEEEEPIQTKPIAEQITPLVQRQEEEEEEEEEEPIQTKPIAEQITPLVQRQEEEEEEEEEEPIQTKLTGGQASQVSPGLQAQIHSIKGSGQPLPESERLFFGSRFGYDFRNVRLFSDNNSALMNMYLKAQAFTIGRDIYFGAGKYNPKSSSGKRLLAHELTHVVQQRSYRNEGAPLLQKWAISGNTAMSDRNSDTLWGLAQKVSKRGRNWSCIRPIKMKSSKAKGKNYPLYIRKGDKFDISNLTKKTGPSLKLFMFDWTSEGKDALLAIRFYPGSIQTAIDSDIDIENVANSGKTPIKSFLIFGHSAGDEMWGGAGRSKPSDHKSSEPKPTFEQAKNWFLPRRCWFTSNAIARAVGCSSMSYGVAFAGTYLRKGAKILTTIKPVWPRCISFLAVDRSKTPPGCHFYEGVAFVRSLISPTITLDGPYWSASSFHGGKHWTTIKGKL